MAVDHFDRIVALNGALAGVRVYLEAIERYRALDLMPDAFLTADALLLVDQALRRDDEAVTARMRAAVDIIAATPRHEPPVFAVAAE